MTPNQGAASLVERLQKRAEAERTIQANNEAVAEALKPQMDAFDRRDGSHNTFAVRLYLDHRDCAKNDAALAADWDEAASTLSALEAENARLRDMADGYGKLDAEYAIAERRAEAAEQQMKAAREYSALWFSPEIPPAIPKGNERYFIVAVRRAHSGTVWTFPATYLNAYPLTFEVCECENEHSDDGCPCTGWYSVSSEGDYDENYSPLLSPGDELVAWSEIQLHPLDARALNPIPEVGE